MLANYFYFHFHFYAHSWANKEEREGEEVEEQQQERERERETIDAVYGAIYDDSTFLFQPQWDKRNLNLLHILWGRGNKNKATLSGGKNNAKTEGRQPERDKA